MVDAIIVPLAPRVQTKTSLGTLASGTLACRALRSHGASRTSWQSAPLCICTLPYQSGGKTASHLARRREVVFCPAAPLFPRREPRSPWCCFWNRPVSGSLITSAGMATERKPRLSASEFRFAPIVSSGPASRRTDACSVSAQGRVHAADGGMHGPMQEQVRGSTLPGQRHLL
jgi:hypothetical protein